GNRQLPLLSATCFLLVLNGCDSVSQDPAQAPVAAEPPAEASAPVEAPEAAAPAVEIEPQRPVVAETLPYAEVDEQLVYGHFVFPADMVDALPGVIVIHEWWGLNDRVRAMADRIAAEGYVVLAVDLFGGKSTRSPAEARELLVSVLENPAPAEDNIRQAYQFLVDSGQAPRIGVLGWDFGGGWALNTAMLLPDEIDAAVIYYGQVIADQRRLAPVNVPILGLFGAQDRGIPVDSVRQFELALENLGKNFEIEIYPKAKHAFADPGSANYDAAIAEQAWARTLAFLDLHLSIDAQ
ncbi:MAG: dienelactone hydrolase family protein, partial [Woeseiaceae bacterium]|nr:dienelactone hydrolase family protein [Woeseiaceae bacterium]